MRNPGRIKIICERLASVWQELPDWRLAQLMMNVISTKACFYMEDNEFIDYIEKYIEELKEKQNAL